jgi:hypothetical protein
MSHTSNSLQEIDMPDDNEQMIRPTMPQVTLKALIVVAATFVINVNIARE